MWQFLIITGKVNTLGEEKQGTIISFMIEHLIKQSTIWNDKNHNNNKKRKKQFF